MKALRCVLLSCLMLSIVGCGDEEVIPVTTPAVAPPVTTGSLKLNNNCSTASIAGAYLSPTSQATWGSNHLTSVLSAGSNFTILNIPAGTYDGKARAVGAFSIYSGFLFNIPITAANTYTVTATDSTFTGSLEITNGTVGANIVGLYVSPSTNPSWGPNQTTNVIAPAAKKHLYDLPSGSYDVKIAWNVGADSIYLARAISSLTLTTATVN